jgi:dihydrofolate reductase
MTSSFPSASDPPHPMVSLIVAHDEARGIGKDNAIPWDFPEDLQFFKLATTTNPSGSKKNALVMGTRTWESLSRRPLPGRKNVVVSRSSGVSLKETLETLKANVEVARIFVIGGGEIYRQCLEEKLVDYLYVTHIPGTFDCDVVFPAYEEGFTCLFRKDMGDRLHRTVWVRK